MASTVKHTPVDTSSRLIGLDVFRGWAIVLMVIFHFVYDLAWFGFVSVDVTRDPFWVYFRYVIVSIFMLSVGMSLALVHRDGIGWGRVGRRAMILGAAAVVVTIATRPVTPCVGLFRYFASDMGRFACGTALCPSAVAGAGDGGADLRRFLERRGPLAGAACAFPLGQAAAPSSALYGGYCALFPVVRGGACRDGGVRSWLVSVVLLMRSSLFAEPLQSLSGLDGAACSGDLSDPSAASLWAGVGMETARQSVAFLLFFSQIMCFWVRLKEKFTIL